VLLYSLHILGFKLISNYADPVSSSGALLEAFDTISKQLRILDDIPLKISTVQPLDSGLTQYLFVFCMVYAIVLKVSPRRCLGVQAIPQRLAKCSPRRAPRRPGGGALSCLAFTP